MSNAFYKNRYFIIYMAADGLMDKVTKRCQKFWPSYSKLAQMVIAEKFDREEQESNGVQGSKVTSPVSHPTTPTSCTEPKTTNNQKQCCSTDRN